MSNTSHFYDKYWRYSVSWTELPLRSKQSKQYVMLDSEPIGNWSGKQELNNDVRQRWNGWFYTPSGRFNCKGVGQLLIRTHSTMFSINTGSLAFQLSFRVTITKTWISWEKFRKWCRNGAKWMKWCGMVLGRMPIYLMAWSINVGTFHPNSRLKTKAWVQ